MIPGIIARARSLWHGVRRRSAIEAEMDEEFRTHIEMRAADLVRLGLSPREADRRARREFGRPERYKAEGSASRSLRGFDELGVSWLDFKLGFRMLVRYPGLTFVGGLAMAFAIWVGAGTFEFLGQIVNPRIPLPEGDRIVAIELTDVAEGRRMPRLLHDYHDWRTDLRSVSELGAYRALERNLITADAVAEPADVAEITASGFGLARVQPLLGRALVAGDESPASPLVMVIGWRLWQRRFGADPGVLGRTVRLGSAPATIVGVMPAGFAFPLSQEVWTPLRINPLDFERAQGPGISVIGRLAPGATLAAAQSELDGLGRRAAVDFPATHEHLRPRVMPLARSWLDLSSAEALSLRSINLFIVMLLALVCSNVALLLFARAVTRENEIVVRTAIGASRGRIITQMFAEALVLGAVGAALGLAAAGFGLRWGLAIAEAQAASLGSLPFWFRSSLSPMTVVYVAILTVLAAVIAGVLPALKVTRGVGTRLRAASAGGGGQRFGGLWTAVIVTQVALTVALPSTAFQLRRDSERIRTLDVGFPTEQYLSVRVEMDRDAASLPPGDTSRTAFVAHYASRVQELERRLASNAAVAGATFAERLPRMYHQWNQIEVDEGAVEPRDGRGHRVSSTTIADDYFEVLRVPLIAGRGFSSGDLASGARVVLVNQPFVDDVLGGRNPIGRRIRFIANEQDRRPKDDGPWFEIVGVAPDLGMTSGYGRAGIYHPMRPTDTYPMYLAVHTRDDPEGFGPTVRATATAIDPALRIDELMPLDEVTGSETQFLSFWFRLTLLISGVALFLSLAGIYAVMAFTVARRTREIGIRIALGASRHRVLASIFTRPLVQVSLGVLAGTCLTAVLAIGINRGEVSPRGTAMVAAYAVLMLAVCLLACIIPTRRALAVEPTEALRSDG